MCHPNGEVNFEAISLYGIDRTTRLNLAGYGDVSRTGLYIFPPHVQQNEYSIWDPMFIGLRRAAYEKIEWIEGLPVYVFSFKACEWMTAGYGYLPDVPEKFLVHTDGQGTIWVEPLWGSW